MLGFGMSAKDSMCITYIFLMGGSISSIISNFKKVHPTENRFVMDYNLILITMPMSASGALFGVNIYQTCIDYTESFCFRARNNHFIYGVTKLSDF